MLNFQVQIRKHFKEIFIILGLLVLYFSLRLPNLTLQPIFADEAIYIRWAQVMRAEPTLRFVSLLDGKTPLFMWAMIPFFKVFPDPLFAGRILSVFSGIATFLGVLFLGWRFFSKRVGIWAVFLYTITPYFIFFDRMALVDSMLSAFSIWSLNLSLLLIQFPRIDLAMVLGYVLGGGLLTKTPGFFNIIAVPFSIITFRFFDKDRSKRVVKIFSLWLIAIIISMVIYNVLRLGPGFSNLNSRNQDYVRSPMSVLVRPWDPFLPHFWDLVDWSSKLLGIPLIIIFFYGLIEVLKNQERRRTSLALLFFSLIPLVIQMAFLQTFTARYILFSFPPLLVLASSGLEVIFRKKPRLFFLMLLFLLVWPLYFNFKLLFSPQSAPLPKNERYGYFEEWTAGYGLKEIAGFLEERSKSADVVVGTEGSFGTLPEGLQIYTDKNKRIAVVPGKATISAGLRTAALTHPTYFVGNKSNYPKYQENTKIILEFPKAKSPEGKGDSTLLLEIMNSKEATVSTTNK